MDYDDLLHDIKKGTLKIPDFQRDVVWKLDQTMALFDSIARGFPVGTFILWETDEYLNSHRNIGDLELNDIPEGHNVNYILDGQQRITSLFASLKKAEINGKNYSIYCDLDAQDEIMFHNKNEEPMDPYRFVNLADILGHNHHKTYNKLNNTKRQERFDKIRDAFKYYNFSTITIKDCSLDLACEIFERINTTGTVLNIFDIMVAKTWSKDFDLRKKYESFIKELKKKGYEGIGSSVILQSISTILKKGIHRREILSIKREDMNDNWDGCIKAIRLAVDFIRSNIGIEAWKLLPYPLIIAPISYFYYHNNFVSPNQSQSEALKKFFWGTCLSRSYSSGSDTKIKSDIKNIELILENKEPEFDFNVILDEETLINCKHSLGDAFCKTVLCYLASKKPRKFENNGKIHLDNSYLAKANSRHFHHFFPKNYLKKKRIYEHANSVVNICLIPADSNLRISNRKPLDYLTEIETCKKSKICNKKLLETLRSHLICDYDDFGIRDDDYDKFLNARAQLIVEGLKKRIGDF